MPPRQPLVQPFSHRPFTVADALEQGYSRRRLEGADLAKPFYGIRSTAAPITPIERARAYFPHLRAGEVFSHSTAAVILGLPLPWRFEADPTIHVATTPAHHIRTQGVVGHRFVSPIPTLWNNGLPATAPARTLIDLATLLGERHLVVAADALLGYAHIDGWNPLRSVEELRDAVVTYSGRRGFRRLLRALERVRMGVESPMETLLRLVLVDGGLPEPVVNGRYWTKDGMYLGKPDLSYPQWRISIEFEGDHHREDQHQFNIDLRRYERFESDDWSVVRVAKDGVLKFPEETVEVVRRRIELRSARVF